MQTVRELLNEIGKYELDARVRLRMAHTMGRYQFVGTPTRVQDGPGEPVYIELLVERIVPGKANLNRQG